MWRFSVTRKAVGGTTLIACAGAIALWTLLRDPTPAEADPKLAPIAKMERKRDVPALTTAARDPDPLIASRAIEALAFLASLKSAKVDPAVARDAIRPAFDDQRPAIRTSAAQAWSAVGTPADVNELRKILSSDGAPEARRAAANAIGRLRAWDGVSELVDAMDDPDALVRQCAYTGVFRMTGAKFQYDIDDRPDVRRATVASIKRMIPAMKPAHDDFMQRFRKAGPP